MYKIRLKNVAKAHQYEELTKIFIKPEEFIIVLDEKDVNASNSISQEEFDNNRELTDKINTLSTEVTEITKENNRIFEELSSELTGK